MARAGERTDSGSRGPPENGSRLLQIEEIGPPINLELMRKGLAGGARCARRSGARL